MYQSIKYLYIVIIANQLTFIIIHTTNIN